MSQAHLEFSTPAGQTALPAPAGPERCAAASDLVTAPSGASGSFPGRGTHHPPNPERLIATL